MTVVQTATIAAPRRSSVFLWAALAYDVLASCAAFAAAYQTGMGLAGEFQPRSLIIHSLTFTAIAAAMVYGHRLNRAIWRYSSLSDAMMIVRASLFTAILVYFPFTVWRNQMGPSPSLAPVLAFFFMVAFLTAPRVLARYHADGRTPKPFTTHPRLNGASVPVIVVGKANRIEPFVRRA